MGTTGCGVIVVVIVVAGETSRAVARSGTPWAAVIFGAVCGRPLLLWRCFRAVGFGGRYDISDLFSIFFLSRLPLSA